MKKLNLRKLYVDFTLVVVLIGTLVFATGFGICLYMSRTNTEKMMNKSVQDNLDLLHTYIDGQLNAVENIVYSLCWSDNRNYAVYDTITMGEISKASMNWMFKSVLNIDSLVSGLTIALAPPYCGLEPGPYGFSIYFSNIRGKDAETIMLSDIYDYTVRDWYAIPMSRLTPYWSKPFQETSRGDIVTSFSLPIIDKDYSTMLGVVVIDICMDRFQNMCSNILPYKNSKTLIIDEDCRFACYPDTIKLLKDIDEAANNGYYSELKKEIKTSDKGIVTLTDGESESLLYFEKVPRTRWTICIECPVEEIYSESNALGRHMLIIAIISVLLLTICFRYLYKRLAKATVANADIESDLNVATKVQMSILPKDQPAFPDRSDIDVYGFLKPAQSVGGDLYDYLVRNDKLFFCIGDVSGKGVPASLFMFAITTFFHNIARTTNSTSEIASTLNNAIASKNKDMTFCTFFVGILDLKTGVLEYCNAGHDGPVIVSTDENGKETARFLDVKSNLAIGIMGDYPYQEQRCELKSGDTIFLFTDGVTEAQGAHRHLFGLDATLNAVKNACAVDSPVADKVNSVYDAILKHTAGEDQSDDITMLMVKYNGRSITLENDIDKLSTLTEFVKEICNEYNIENECKNSLLVSVDEIGSNIAMYAYPEGEHNTFTVRFQKANNELRFIFEDTGVEFDPTVERDVDTESSCAERPIGGLGIFLTQQLMDKVEYKRVANKNILTITKIY